MNAPRLDRVWGFFAGLQPAMAIFWLGLAIFTVGLGVLLYTRWGQYRPLRKCMVLSLLAHLMLACYAATIQIVMPVRAPAEPIIHLSIGDGPTEKGVGGAGTLLGTTKDQPWEVFPDGAAERPDPTELGRGETDPPSEPKRLVRTDAPRLPSDPVLDAVALADPKPLSSRATPAKAATRSLPGDAPVAIKAPPAQRRDAVAPLMPGAAAPLERSASDPPGRPVRSSSDDLPLALLQQPTPLPRMADGEGDRSRLPQSGPEGAGHKRDLSPSEPLDESAGPHAMPQNPLRVKPFDRANGNGEMANGDGDSLRGGDQTPGLLASSGSDTSSASRATAGLPSSAGNTAGQASSGTPVPSAVPDAYRLRVAPDRAGVAQSRGGTAETEAAVKAALRWLADNQSANGRWDAKTHGGGRETNVAGRDRGGAGGTADSAVTGLALLAFLASGHTHLDGPYREDIRRALEYLIRIQAPDGNLGGQAATFEFMYCHAMAACALSEAYGMTRDSRLREPVRRAVGYTVRAQDPVGGGWRYKPGDAGDTSQLGWQLMALKSAELAGIPIPDTTRQGVIRYLQSVSSGTYGGRAAYRPSEQPSRSMTAESLFCWQLLGLPRQHPAGGEAADYVLEETPGEGTYNLYYWYYATLSMYQLHDAHWQRWNDALRAALLSRQVHQKGPLAGSWDTSDLWGSYGGRVYTTALATLTLEVYYRFLPLYVDVAAADRQVR